MARAPKKRAAMRDWLRLRLTDGPRPRQEWRELWEATWQHLLATRVHDLVDADATKALAHRLLDPNLVTDLVRPVASNIAGVVVAELRLDREPVDRFLPPEALGKLQAAIARPGLVHPDWVRAMFRGEAAEAVLNDALYRALKDFSTLLPRLLVKLSPMGRFGALGGAGVLAEKLIDDLEKRVEPEIKSFLADSTERVLERAAEFTIDKIDDPASIEFRSTFIRFVLSQSPAFFLEAAEDELIEDMGAVVELTARHLMDTPEMQDGVREGIDRVMAYCADKTLGEALEVDPSKLQMPIDALADATWPVFTNVVSSPQAQSWIDQLLGELLDEYERSA